MLCALLANRLRFMNNDVLISVIIPCFDQAHYLEEAIQSVLAQSHQHYEIIAVDDGSRDNTTEVASRYAHGQHGD